MSCETTRLRLLRSESPDRPPADVQPHLAECAACRAWQRGLTRLEKRITQLDMPPSAPPPELIQRILHSPPPLREEPPPLPQAGTPPWWETAAVPPAATGPTPWWVNNPLAERSPDGIQRRQDPSAPSAERTRRKVAVAFALTLGLAVFALAWGLWSHVPNSVALPHPSSLARREAGLEAKLLEARTPVERIRVLDDFATRLGREALAAVRTSDLDDLASVAKLYGQVVNERLPQLARSLPHEERRAVLETVAANLRKTDSELEHEAQNVAPSAAESLHAMARAAREGQGQIEALLRKV